MTNTETDQPAAETHGIEPLTLWRHSRHPETLLAVVLSSPDADDELTIVDNKGGHVGEIDLVSFTRNFDVRLTAEEAARVLDAHDDRVGGLSENGRRAIKLARALTPDKMSRRAVAVLTEICDHVADRGRFYPSLSDTQKLKSILGLSSAQLAPTLNLLIDRGLVKHGGEQVGSLICYPTVRGAIMYARLQAQQAG